MRSRSDRVLLALGVLLLVTGLYESTALARDIYVNGTKLEGRGLTSQTFEKARVRFDARGDVYIDVEGVNVQVVQTEGRPQSVPFRRPVAHRYFVEASQFRQGLAQFDVEVHINGQAAASFKANRPQAAVEVTQYLRAGDNQVLFVANKSGGVRKSLSRRDYMRVSLFKGTVQGDNVLVSQVLRTFERTAAHSASSAEEHRVKAE